jgi:hypothetical protein
MLTIDREPHIGTSVEQRIDRMRHLHGLRPSRVRDPFAIDSTVPVVRSLR